MRPERRTEALDGSADAVHVVCDATPPVGHSSLELALVIIAGLVKDHGGVVIETDVRVDGTGTIMMQLPRSVPHASPV